MHVYTFALYVYVYNYAYTLYMEMYVQGFVTHFKPLHVMCTLQWTRNKTFPSHMYDSVHACNRCCAVDEALLHIQDLACLIHNSVHAPPQVPRSERGSVEVPPMVPSMPIGCSHLTVSTKMYFGRFYYFYFIFYSLFSQQ